MPRQRKLGGAESNFRQLLLGYKRGAKRRNLKFSLTVDRFRELTRAKCFLCGVKPRKKYRHSRKIVYYAKPYIFNGIDRVKNTRGYVEGNVITCCWKCNRAKSSLSLADFLLHTLDIFNHRIKPALIKGDDPND